MEYARGKRITLGRAEVVTPQQARDQAKEILADAYRGLDPLAAARQARNHTFGSFIDEEYANWARANIRTHRGTLHRLNANFAAFRPLRLHEITPLLVERWRSERLSGGAKVSTVNRCLDDLKSSAGQGGAMGLHRHPPGREGDAIVTFNLRDFTAAALAPYGLEVIHPDDFVRYQLDLDLARVLEAVRTCRARLKNPPKSVQDYLDTLEAQTLPKTVGDLRRYFAIL